MSHKIYETYLSDMKRLGASEPYMTEAQVLESAGIVIEEDVIEPLRIRPKNKRPVIATIENYAKVEKPKKVKVERKPRIKMTDEEKRKKKNEWRKSYLQSEKGRAKRREINARYAERNRLKLNAEAVRRYHEKKA